MPSQQRSLALNLLTLVALFSSCLVAACFALIFVNPQAVFNPLKPPTAVPTAGLPAPTDTPKFPTLPPPFTPTSPPPPTDTLPPSTPTPSFTPTPSPTFGPTPTFFAVEPSPTTPEVGTGTASATATVTHTPTPTATGPTPTPSRTLSAQPWTLLGAVSSQADQYGLRCGWMGIAGTALDLNNQHKTGLIVRLNGGGYTNIDSVTGSKTAYGPSGYEFFLSGVKAVTGEYKVQLLDPSGNPLSDVVSVDTTDDCDRNTYIVNWVQNH